MREIEIKLKRVRQIIDEKELDGVLLTKKANFSWITGGKDCHIENVGETGAGQILITKDDQYLLTNNIEVVRLMEEELVDLNFNNQVVQWYASTNLENFANLTLGTDGYLPQMLNITDQLTQARAALTQEEIDRYRWLGRKVSEILEKTSREIKKGESEFEIAARLSNSLIIEGITPYVTLVAVDERVFKYRHPIPTSKRVEKYAMVVVCAEKWGLIANATRLVHFGGLSLELKKKLDAVATVEAALLTSTRPGVQINHIFDQGVKSYSKVGYPDEWKLHHQGGPTGYFPRDYVATPERMDKVQLNQAFAWNPSITGVKSEDTILVTASGFEYLTSPGDWPVIDVNAQGEKLVRPDILIK